MLKVSIKGLVNGTYPVEAATECSSIANVFPEFFGTLSVTGTVRKHQKRYIFKLHAEADARLVCDVSGEEYVERVQADFSLEYIADTQLAILQAEKGDIGAEPPFYIRDDDTSINITDEVRQEMAVSLPLKRVAPQYQGKEFSEVFPEHAATETEEQLPDNTQADPRWAALKNISFKN
jgi:uncharacterized metal-binding protein YceD (DUF177 family)